MVPCVCVCVSGVVCVVCVSDVVYVCVWVCMSSDCESVLHLRKFCCFFPSEFVAGEMVKSLIGFSNNGDNEFVVTGIEASFRCVCVCVVCTCLSTILPQVSTRFQLLHSKCKFLLFVCVCVSNYRVVPMIKKSLWPDREDLMQLCVCMVCLCVLPMVTQ